jgi:hypothetical protein
VYTCVEKQSSFSMLLLDFQNTRVPSLSWQVIVFYTL